MEEKTCNCCNDECCDCDNNVTDTQHLVAIRLTTGQVQIDLNMIDWNELSEKSDELVNNLNILYHMAYDLLMHQPEELDEFCDSLNSQIDEFMLKFSIKLQNDEMFTNINKRELVLSKIFDTIAIMLVLIKYVEQHEMIMDFNDKIACSRNQIAEALNTIFSDNINDAFSDVENGCENCCNESCHECCDCDKECCDEDGFDSIPILYHVHYNTETEEFTAHPIQDLYDFYNELNLIDTVQHSIIDGFDHYDTFVMATTEGEAYTIARRRIFDNGDNQTVDSIS